MVQTTTIPRMIAMPSMRYDFTVTNQSRRPTAEAAERQTGLANDKRRMKPTAAITEGEALILAATRAKTAAAVERVAAVVIDPQCWGLTFGH